MLDLAPEGMHHGFDLQLKIHFAAVEQIITVDPVNRKAVALQLGLGHRQIQTEIRIKHALGIFLIFDKAEMMADRLVNPVFIADKAAFYGQADQIGKEIENFLAC